MIYIKWLTFQYSNTNSFNWKNDWLKWYFHDELSEILKEHILNIESSSKSDFQKIQKSDLQGNEKKLP